MQSEVHASGLQRTPRALSGSSIARQLTPRTKSLNAMSPAVLQYCELRPQASSQLSSAFARTTLFAPRHGARSARTAPRILAGAPRSCVTVATHVEAGDFAAKLTVGESRTTHRASMSLRSHAVALSRESISWVHWISYRAPRRRQKANAHLVATGHVIRAAAPTKMGAHNSEKLGIGAFYK